MLAGIAGSIGGLAPAVVGGGGGGGPILDGLTATGAWSMSRDLFASFSGSDRYTDVSGVVSSLNDQSGNSRHLAQGTAGARPAITTAGPNNIACAGFDGSNDRLIGAALSNFIANTAGYVIVSFMADAITANSGAVYQTHTIVGDSGSGYFGLFLRNTDADVGDPDTLYGYNWDGSSDTVSSTTILLDTPFVAEWLHEGGVLSLRINGGTPITVASGNTQSLAALFTFGSNNGSSFQSLIGKGFELATFSGANVPDSATRDALAADFMAHIGAV